MRWPVANSSTLLMDIWGLVHIAVVFRDDLGKGGDADGQFFHGVFPERAVAGAL